MSNVLMKTIKLCCQINGGVKRCRICNNLVCNDCITCSDKCATKLEKKVRSRVSYNRWEDYHREIKGVKTEADILLFAFGLLNQHWVFKSNTKAMYAKESLDQYIKDKLEVKCTL